MSTPLEVAQSWLQDNPAHILPTIITMPTGGVIVLTDWWILVVPCDLTPQFITMD